MPEPVMFIVFARVPVPGRAKTRLCPPLTPEQAASVYEASLKDVVRLAERTGTDLQIHYAGDDDYFARAFPELERRGQAGGDLGRRMETAFGHVFRGGDPAHVRNLFVDAIDDIE